MARAERGDVVVIEQQAKIPDEVAGGVLVAGAGVSGRGVAALLTELGVRCVVADDNPESARVVREATGAETVTTAEAPGYFGEVGCVVTSPGWRPDSPLLVDATSYGLPVFGDVELCYRLDRAGVFGAPRQWLVVTGTNGKTTTTGMLAAMMQQAAKTTGKKAQACGNIGVAVADALRAAERVDVLVAELSSFQLHWSQQLVPDAGVLLNLADDHLDWHGSFAAYAEAKAKVLRAPIAVAGIDDAHVAEILRTLGRDDVTGFTLQPPLPGEVGVVGEDIVAYLPREAAGQPQRETVAGTAGIEPAGKAGVLDALAAAAIALRCGATTADVQAALAQYKVAGHRGAVVHEAGGVRWVDNSKATNPHAADSALAGAGPVVWIAGGQLKGASVDALVEKHGSQLRAVALLGVDRAQIAAAIARYAPHVPVFVSDATDPQQAIDEVVAFAARYAQAGESVVLAPAAASLDMFSGMAQRGDMFAAAAVRYGSSIG